MLSDSKKRKGADNQSPTARGLAGGSLPYIIEQWYPTEPTLYNIYTISVWVDPVTSVNYVDFFILMPSGVKHNNQYEVNVSECGTKLFLSIVWPRHTTDKTILVKVAQKNDPGLTELSPCAAGLNASFRQLTEKLGQNVEMTYYMNVPIKVEQVIQIVDSTETLAGPTFVHVRLQGMTDSFVTKTVVQGLIEKATF